MTRRRIGVAVVGFGWMGRVHTHAYARVLQHFPQLRLAPDRKHIWVEKPVGLAAADAKAVAEEVMKAGLRCTVGFNYRNAPAVEHARTLIEQGRIGTPTHARFRLLSDYAVVTLLADDGYHNQSISTVFAGPGHGDLGVPAGGRVALGFDDLKIVEGARFLQSIADGKPYGPTIEDALPAALALDAMAESARTGDWVAVA